MGPDTMGCSIGQGVGAEWWVGSGDSSSLVFWNIGSWTGGEIRGGVGIEGICNGAVR